MGKDLPPLINMWGEPIKNVPEGKNAYVHFLFDVTKGQKVDKKQFGIQLYDLYKRTENKDVIPSVIPREISIEGNKRKLTPKEYELLSIRVGKARTKEVQGLLSNRDFNALSDGDKVKRIKKALKTGRDLGFGLFIKELGIEKGAEQID